jgi:hypothetical protein
MSDLKHCLAILQALQVSEVRYCLSGGGDSGTTDLEEVMLSISTAVMAPSPPSRSASPVAAAPSLSTNASKTSLRIFPTATGATTKAATATSFSARRRSTTTYRSNAT